METQSRNIGIDIVKTFAIIFVIAQHFYLANTSFKDLPFVGPSMFIHSFFLNVYLMAVPLFLLATGYLNSKKSISKNYFLKIFRVLFSYLIFSLVTLCYRRFYLLQDIGIISGAKMILAFNAIPYGWYIEMWIGLYLLTPFLNILYNGILCKKHKQIGLIILYVLTAFPLFINRHGGHWVPGFWQQIWPLFYFFAGRYVEEYKPQTLSSRLLLMVLLIAIVNPLLNVFYPGDHVYLHITGDYILMMPMAVSFFMLCLNIHHIKTSVCRIALKFSVLSLDMYLCCWIFDATLYPLVERTNWNLFQSLLMQFIIIVPFVVLGSFLFAQLKRLIFCWIQKLFICILNVFPPLRRQTI